MNIIVQQLKEKLDAGENFVFIDVREPHEFNEFNLGAQLIPLATLPDALEGLADAKNQEVIVHCRSGARSARAQEFLMANGFTNVKNLQGGVMAWMDVFGV